MRRIIDIEKPSAHLGITITTSLSGVEQEYMSALVGSEHGNTDQALEAVRIHVDAMVDTVRELTK